MLASVRWLHHIDARHGSAAAPLLLSVAQNTHTLLSAPLDPASSLPAYLPRSLRPGFLCWGLHPIRVTPAHSGTARALSVCVSQSAHALNTLPAVLLARDLATDLSLPVRARACVRLGRVDGRVRVGRCSEQLRARATPRESSTWSALSLSRSKMHTWRLRSRRRRSSATSHSQ